MAENIKWKGEEIKKKIELDLLDKLDLAGFLILKNAQKIVGRDQPRGKTKSGTRTGLRPSLAGTPPKRVTATLQKSIFWDLDRSAKKGRVGSPLKYAKFLELGTRKMARRPWLSKADTASRGRIRRIFKKELKG